MKRVLFALAALFAAVQMAFAAVDVNKATAAELDSVKGIGPSISKAITDERAKGQFKDWNDLVSRVKGIGDDSAKKLSEGGLTVGGKAYAGAPAKAEAKKEDKPAAAAGAKEAPKADAKAAKDAKPAADVKQDPKAQAAADKQAKADAKAKAEADKKAKADADKKAKAEAKAKADADKKAKADAAKAPAAKDAKPAAKDAKDAKKEEPKK